MKFLMLFNSARTFQGNFWENCKSLIFASHEKVQKEPEDIMLLLMKWNKLLVNSRKLFYFSMTSLPIFIL